MRTAHAPATAAAAAAAAVIVVFMSTLAAGPSACRPSPTRQAAPRTGRRNPPRLKLDRRVPITVAVTDVDVAAAVVVGRARRVVLVSSREGRPRRVVAPGRLAPARRRSLLGERRMNARQGGKVPIPVGAPAARRSYPPRQWDPLLGTPPGGAPRRRPVLRSQLLRVSRVRRHHLGQIRGVRSGQPPSPWQ